MPCKICKGNGHNSRTCKQEVIIDVSDDSITPITPIAQVISNKKY